MTDSAPETPRTEAGRALLDLLEDVFADDEGEMPEDPLSDILAIEREAAAPAATEALTLCGHCGHPMHWRECGANADQTAPCQCRNDHALASPEPTPKPDGWHTYHVCDGLLRELTFVAGRAYCLVCDQWYPPIPATGLSAEALRAEIRGMLADLLVTLDAPNPRLALQTGIEAIDYRLAHFDYIAARTPTDSSEESA